MQRNKHTYSSGKDSLTKTATDGKKKKKINQHLQVNYII